MDIFLRKRYQRSLLFISFIFLYMFTALLWWYMVLMKQNEKHSSRELVLIQQNISLSPQHLQQLNQDVGLAQQKAIRQYHGEGIAFGVVLLLTYAAFLFVLRRQYKTLNDQHDFLMSITHELKTPITTININLNTLLNQKISTKEKKILLQYSLKEVDRLNWMSSQFLASARLENKMFFDSELSESIDLEQLLVYAIERYKKHSPTLQVQASLDKHICISGNRLLIEVMIYNLIENALIHGASDFPLQMVLHRDKNKIVFSIQDRGKGIAPGDEKKIFKKYFSRRFQHKGNGFGLYAVSLIAKAHKGRVLLRKNQPQGAIFDIVFPANKI